MKLDNGNDRQERRKKRFIMPLVYLVAELTLAWLIVSIIQIDFNIANWKLWGKALLGLVAIYSLSKTIRVFKRQKELKSN